MCESNEEKRDWLNRHGWYESSGEWYRAGCSGRPIPFEAALELEIYIQDWLTRYHDERESLSPSMEVVK